jgi:hypothetical protein
MIYHLITFKDVSIGWKSEQLQLPHIIQFLGFYLLYNAVMKRLKNKWWTLDKLP